MKMTAVKAESVMENLRKMPRDRGWAWIVLIAAWLNNIMVSGIYKSFGILFIEIQTKFGSTSAHTSLVYSLLNASFSFTSLLIAVLDLKTLSVRQLISLGTALSCLGYLVPAFVSNVDLVVVFLGVGLGVGQGFIYTPQMALLGQYFDRRKGLANCIAMTGGSAGSMILPYLMGSFLDQYGFSGTMLLLAGLNMNGIVFAAFMRPFPLKEYNRLKEMADAQALDDAPDLANVSVDELESNTDTFKAVNGGIHDYKDNVKMLNYCGENKLQNGKPIKLNDGDSSQKINEDEFKEIQKIVIESSDTHNKTRVQMDYNVVTEPSESDKETVSMLDKTKHRKPSQINKGCKHPCPDEVNKMKAESPFLHSPYLQRSFGAIGRSSLYASSEFTVVSIEDISIYERPQTMQEIKDDVCITKDVSVCAKLKSKLKALLNIRVLKTPVFLYYLPFAVLIANGSSMYLSFMLPHAKDVGLSGTEIKSLITVIGVLDIIAIPVWGMLADRRFFTSNKLVAIGMVCIGVPALFVSYYDSYATILMLSSFYGICGRLYFSLSPVILVEFLGLDNLRSSVGICLVVQAVFHSIMVAIVGLMRDEYGTYEASYQMMGAFLLVGATGILVMPELARKIHGDPLANQKDLA